MKTVSAQLRGWHFAVALAIVGTLAVGALAFAMSFTKLSRLAILYNVDETQAWMFPLIVDGLIVVSTIATATMNQHRWYAWTLLLTGSAVSVAGNGIQAWVTTESALAVGIAVVPPLVLLGVTHLTMLLVADRPAPREITAPVETEQLDLEPVTDAVTTPVENAVTAPEPILEHTTNRSPRRAASRELVNAGH